MEVAVPIPVHPPSEDSSCNNDDPSAVQHLPALRAGLALDACPIKPRHWVNDMVDCTYFCPCDVHKGLKKNECTYFCTTCGPECGALCPHCLPNHDGHHLLQIRRYVYCDVVRVQDICNFADITGIQAYIINGAKVVFLNPRQQAGGGGGGAKGGSGARGAAPPSPGATEAEAPVCASCHRMLREGCQFCCLACKLDSGEQPPGSGPPSVRLPPPPKPRTVAAARHKQEPQQPVKRSLADVQSDADDLSEPGSSVSSGLHHPAHHNSASGHGPRSGTCGTASPPPGGGGGKPPLPPRKRTARSDGDGGKASGTASRTPPHGSPFKSSMTAFGSGAALLMASDAAALSLSQQQQQQQHAASRGGSAAATAAAAGSASWRQRSSSSPGGSQPPSPSLRSPSSQRKQRAPCRSALD